MIVKIVCWNIFDLWDLSESYVVFIIDYQFSMNLSQTSADFLEFIQEFS